MAGSPIIDLPAFRIVRLPIKWRLPKTLNVEIVRSVVAGLAPFRGEANEKICDVALRV